MRTKSHEDTGVLMHGIAIVARARCTRHLPVGKVASAMSPRSTRRMRATRSLGELVRGVQLARAGLD